jgi:hypothetical protein
MDKFQIQDVLENEYGTSDPLEVPERERWLLYERFKQSLGYIDPDEYTRQIILITDALEL